MKNNAVIVVILVVVIILLAYIAFKPENTFQITPSEKVDSSKTNAPQETPNDQVKLYIEEVKNPDEFLVGSMGKTYRLIATSQSPATITYTLKYNTAAVYPGVIAKDNSVTKTISLSSGTTTVQTFTSVDMPTVTYTVN